MDEDCQKTQDDIRLAMHIEWYQTGLKTFFWAGVLNAIFAATGAFALLECKRSVTQAELILERAKTVQKMNSVDIEKHEMLSKSIDAKSERISRSEMNMVQTYRWIKNEFGKIQRELHPEQYAEYVE